MERYRRWDRDNNGGWFHRENLNNAQGRGSANGREAIVNERTFLHLYLMSV
jgi:hypothetical protein